MIFSHSLTFQLHTLDSEKDEHKSSDTWLDLSDEDSCNWMMFVRPAQNYLEQNLVAYQYGSEIFYTCIKHIQPKQELKVSQSWVLQSEPSCCPRGKTTNEAIPRAAGGFNVCI